jgi:hypothetical protein
LAKFVKRRRGDLEKEMNNTFQQEMYYSPNNKNLSERKDNGQFKLFKFQIYSKYERLKSQDHKMLNILTDSQKSMKSMLKFIFEYVKSIVNLNKRRHVLNSQYSEFNNETPLMIAIRVLGKKQKGGYNYLADIVEFMIKNGADIRLLNSQKQNVYHYVAQYGNIDVLKIIRLEDKHLRGKGISMHASHFSHNNINNELQSQVSSLTSLRSIKSSNCKASGEFSTTFYDSNSDQSHIILCTVENGVKKNLRFSNRLK